MQRSLRYDVYAHQGLLPTKEQSAEYKLENIQCVTKGEIYFSQGMTVNIIPTLLLCLCESLCVLMVPLYLFSPGSM